MHPSTSHHALHGSFVSSPSEAATRPSLLSACGRLVAVCAPGGPAVDLYDAHDVAELSSVLGPGSCKLRFVASFPVTDIADPVALQSIAFLRGGVLALVGVCSRGCGERPPAPFPLSTPFP